MQQEENEKQPNWKQFGSRRTINERDSSTRDFVARFTFNILPTPALHSQQRARTLTKEEENSPERHVCWFRGSGYEPRLYISELSTMFTTSLCMKTEPKINQASERRIYGDLEWGREKVFLRRFYAMPLWQCRNGGRCGGWVGLVWRWMERENTGRSSVSYLQLCWLAGSSRLCFEIHFKFRMLILI